VTDDFLNLNPMSEPLQSIISEARNLAVAHGKATLSGDYKSGNRAFDKLMAIVPVIRGYGYDGEVALLQLTEDADDSVVCWAATIVLKSNEAKAIAALEKVSKKTGIIAFNAQMVLKQWKKGELVLPCWEETQ
jgi:hypothetical protein